MIAPEPDRGINAQTRLWVLLRNNLLASTLIFALLEFWRPYFFLTDDNLDGAFPFFTGVGRNLLAGHSPFVTHHLFGGNYNFLRDPSAFVWHPVYLVITLLAGTPFHNAIMDVIVFFLFAVATSGFVTLCYYLRRDMPLTISDGWIMFYSLSFTYTIAALTVGSSWYSFLGNYGALPWLVLGVLQKSWRAGIALVTLFSLHQLLGGHLSPTISSSIFLSLFALGLSIERRSWLPLVNWGVGYAAAVLIILPLLLPMIDGFLHSYRSGGVPFEDMQANNVPASQFPTAVFFGMALWIINPHPHPYTTYTLALGSSAAAWCILPAMVSRAKWRGIEVVILLVLAFITVLICRPEFVTRIMMQLPLFKSMRWPFREFIQFQFFLHLYLVIRPPGLDRLGRKIAAVLGSVVMIIPMWLFPLPPTINSMTWNRELVLDGEMFPYWDHVRTFLKPTDRIAVLIPFDIFDNNRYEEPYALLGTYNYAVLANVINAWGYSPTAPRDQVYTSTYAFYPFGAYLPSQKNALMVERPDLKFITLESLHPLKITLSSKDGPTIDLTPLCHRGIPPFPRARCLLECFTRDPGLDFGEPFRRQPTSQGQDRGTHLRLHRIARCPALAYWQEAHQRR